MGSGTGGSWGAGAGNAIENLRAALLGQPAGAAAAAAAAEAESATKAAKAAAAMAEAPETKTPLSHFKLERKRRALLAERTTSPTPADAAVTTVSATTSFHSAASAVAEDLGGGGSGSSSGGRSTVQQIIDESQDRVHRTVRQAALPTREQVISQPSSIYRDATHTIPTITHTHALSDILNRHAYAIWWSGSWCDSSGLRGRWH